MATKVLQMVFWGLLFSPLYTMAQCANTSNIYSFTFNGKNYEIVKELKTWVDAAACAVERGGYLVEITNQNEQEAVFNAIFDAGVSQTYTSVPNGGGIAYVWIGATDQANEGIWLWDGDNDNNGFHFWTGQGSNGSGNGYAVGGAYNNWGGSSTGVIKEPDNFGSGQHHAAIGLTGWPSGSTMLGIAGEWNDIIGTSLLYFIIEYNAGVGMNDVENRSEKTLYPNPCFDKVIIKSDMCINGLNFRIYDKLGKLVMNDTFNENNEISIVGLNRGFYYLQIDGHFSNAIKFVKQ